MKTEDDGDEKQQSFNEYEDSPIPTIEADRATVHAASLHHHGSGDPPGVKFSKHSASLSTQQQFAFAMMTTALFCSISISYFFFPLFSF